MRPRSLVLCLLLALLALPAVAPHARAQELIAPKTTDRKFPQGVFCPLPFDVAFTANGPNAILRFSTETVNFFNSNNSAEEWSEQYLDNICVAPDDVFQAHQGGLGSSHSDCYIGAPLAATFHFQDAGTLPMKETFDSDPTARGWDLTHGAYWSSTTTAPLTPGSDPDVLTPKGALGLGAFDAALSPTDSAFTTAAVHGLTPGAVYHLTGWWNVNNMNLDKIFLTVAVLGDPATPAARETWGVVKLRYR